MATLQESINQIKYLRILVTKCRLYNQFSRKILILGLWFDENKVIHLKSRQIGAFPFRCNRKTGQK